MYLAHHGILGQKWGIRRYQNSDGSLTPAGKVRYAKEGYKMAQKTYGNKRGGHNPEAEKRYQAYLKKSGFADEVYKNKRVSDANKKLDELHEKAKNIKKLDEYSPEFLDKLYKEANKGDGFKKWLGTDPSELSERDREKLFDQYVYEEVYDKVEAKFKSKEEKAWEREFDKASNDYKEALYSSIDDIVANRGKLIVNGYGGGGWTYREILNWELTKMQRNIP